MTSAFKQHQCKAQACHPSIVVDAAHPSENTAPSHSTLLFPQGYTPTAHPMAIMLGTVGALAAFYDSKWTTAEQRDLAAHRLIAKIPTVAAWAFKYSRGEPFVYPQNNLSYAENFLHMLFSRYSGGKQWGAMAGNAVMRAVLKERCHF